MTHDLWMLLSLVVLTELTEPYLTPEACMSNLLRIQRVMNPSAPERA